MVCMSPDNLIDLHSEGFPGFSSLNSDVRQKCPPLSIKVATKTLPYIPLIIAVVTVKPIKTCSI